MRKYSEPIYRRVGDDDDFDGYNQLEVTCDMCEDECEITQHESDVLELMMNIGETQNEDAQDICPACISKLDRWFCDFCDHSKVIRGGVRKFRGLEYMFKENQDGEIIMNSVILI
jgi:hypothetical protein